MIFNKDFTPDKSSQALCGKCEKCIEKCPTNAITEPFVINSDLCIAYHTIENRNLNFPEHIEKNLNGWIAGCDICQDVCPWNRFSTPHQEPQFEPSPGLLQMSKGDWQEITESVFDRLFADSAVQRTQFSGLKRNLDFLR